MCRVLIFSIFIVNSISSGLGLHLMGGNSLTRTGKLSELNPDNYTFHDFVAHFERPYKDGSTEWQRREKLFQANLQKLIDVRKTFVNKTNATWRPSITMFLDYDDTEWKNLLGYKRTGIAPLGMVSLGRNVTTAQSNITETAGTIPSHFSTLTSDKTLTGRVRQQGGCGSCWAEAAVATIEGVLETQPDMLKFMKDEIKRRDDKIGMLSTEAVVKCTLNKRNCGGTGGCHGATTELGFEMVKERGIPLASVWPYTARSGKCEEDRFKKTMLITIDTYRVLPKNELKPLMSALVERGHPIAISVDASHWHMYNDGIYSDTDRGHSGDFTINHAVVLVAFQNPGYWLIKNSWGSYYGEDGFIRIELKHNEATHCGWDKQTHQGIACDGDPDEDWVCGTCGILYDTTYPNKVKSLT